MGWIDELRVEDLPEPHRGIAELIGAEAMVRLVHAYGGERLYIPKEDKLHTMVRDKRLIDDYKRGIHINALARKYNLSYNQVHMIIRHGYDYGVSGQLSLFDEG